MAPSASPFAPNPFRTETYDPEPGREKIRGWIALLAIATFFVLVAFYLYEANTGSDASWLRLKEAMQSTLPAVTSVLGTVLGFYFGSQKR
jgi:hypothetical protein